MFKPGPDADVQVVEPKFIRDDYVTDCASIEAVGPCARFTMVVAAKAPGGGGTELLVVRKMLVPIDALQSIVERTQAFIDECRQCQMARASGMLN